MNDTRKCPDLNLLKKFAVGAVDVHKLHSIGEHLDECETCQNAIESIHSNEDRLLLALQRSVAVETLQTADTSIAPSAKPSQQTTELEIPSTFGRYTIHKVLGQGAMGAVYLARDTQLDRDVALKIPKFAVGNGVDDAELLERFYREARASATLRSPNICPVHDVGEIDGQHYITMSFIDGRPLKDFTKSKQKHTERQIVKTIRKLALGLEQAHKIGVIHRDLKPANIMVDLPRFGGRSVRV